MKPNEIRRIQMLVEDWNEINKIISDLNGISGGQEFLSFPTAALRFVDRQSAAKGLLSLVVESAAKIRSDLEMYGVDLS